jgi:hypothetical protein
VQRGITITGRGKPVITGIPRPISFLGIFDTLSLHNRIFLDRYINTLPLYATTLLDDKTLETSTFLIQFIVLSFYGGVFPNYNAQAGSVLNVQ